MWQTARELEYPSARAMPTAAAASSGGALTHVSRR